MINTFDYQRQPHMQRVSISLFVITHVALAAENNTFDDDNVEELIMYLFNRVIN